MRTPRRTSDAENFPYKEETVPFIMRYNGLIQYAVTVTDKLEMLCRPDSFTIVAVWPGKTRSDAFIVNREHARKALS